MRRLTRCPICDGASARVFEKHGHWIRECGPCSHRFAEILHGANDVASVYDDDYFFAGGPGYPDYLASGPEVRRQASWYVRLLSGYVEPGTVLDVGAAAGFRLGVYLDHGWSGSGIEPNPRMAHHARSRLDLTVEDGTLEQLRTEERYDLLSMIQVVPHFYDVRRAFRIASEITRTDGFWLVESWNRTSWTARCFGRHWHEYSPPSVLNWFSPDGLERLAGQFGMRLVASGRPAKPLGAAHAKSLLRYRMGNSRTGPLLLAITAVIPDRWTLRYPAEDLFWALFRKA